MSAASLLLILVLSTGFIYLLYKFARYAAALYITLCAMVVLSFPLMVYNTDWGVNLLAWSLALLLCSYLLVVFSGFFVGLGVIFIIFPLRSLRFAARLLISKFK